MISAYIYRKLVIALRGF